MNWSFVETPRPYGPAHILILLGIAALLILFWIASRNAREKTLMRILFGCGLFMLAAEVFKQWFVIRYIYAGTPSMWFFPWQLCSMAMYCSALVPFLKGKAQEAVLVFLSTFSAIGAVFALAIPDDMMRPQILLFIHSFLYHGVMLIESMAAILILRKRTRTSFIPALIMYAGMAVIAEIVNIISHQFAATTQAEANMFYITPFYPSTQPVFRAIAERAGVWVEILVYLGAIALAAYLLYRLETLLLKKGPSRQP